MGIQWGAEWARIERGAGKGGGKGGNGVIGSGRAVCVCVCARARVRVCVAGLREQSGRERGATRRRGEYALKRLGRWAGHPSQAALYTLVEICVDSEGGRARKMGIYRRSHLQNLYGVKPQRLKQAALIHTCTYTHVHNGFTP